MSETSKTALIMKSEAYKALVDIERILSTTDIYVKREKQLPITLISELDKLGDLSKSIESYLKATEDKVIISKVSAIPRAIFHKLMAWYDIKQQTRLSIAFCSKSLCDIAAMAQTKTDKSEENLPTELDTTEAKELFQRAIKAGLMSQTDSGYKWLKSKVLCAYFGDRATECLGISKALTTNEEKAANWKPFENLFGYTNLKNCKADWRKTGTLPKGYTAVDSLFD